MIKTRTLKFTNESMYVLISLLNNLSDLKLTGRLGYAVARNLRKLQDCSLDYTRLRDQYIMAHGTKAEDGTYSIDVDAFMEELGDVANDSSEVEITLISEDDIINSSLTSDQIVNLLWMIEDSTSPDDKDSE